MWIIILRTSPSQYSLRGIRTWANNIVEWYQIFSGLRVAVRITLLTVMNPSTTNKTRCQYLTWNLSLEAISHSLVISNLNGSVSFWHCVPVNPFSQRFRVDELFKSDPAVTYVSQEIHIISFMLIIVVLISNSRKPRRARTLSGMHGLATKSSFSGSDTTTHPADNFAGIHSMFDCIARGPAKNSRRYPWPVGIESGWLNSWHWGMRV
jgi:hypothetical protein